MKKLARKQVEKLVQAFDATGYAQRVGSRGGVMFSMPEHDVAGYGGDYISALVNADTGCFAPTDEQKRVAAIVSEMGMELWRAAEDSHDSLAAALRHAVARVARLMPPPVGFVFDEVNVK